MPFKNTWLGRQLLHLGTAWKNRRAIVRVLQGIKIAVESERAIDVTNAIPGQWDNRLRVILDTYLPPVIRAIGILDSADKKYNDTNSLEAAIKRMKEYAQLGDKREVGRKLNEIGAQVYIRMQNGKNMAKANELIEETYQEMKAKGELV